MPGQGNGGAIDYESTIAGSSLSVSNVTFTGNSAPYGGAIYAAPSSGPVMVSDSYFGPSPASAATPAIPGNVASFISGAIDYLGPPRSPLPTTRSCPTWPSTDRRPIRYQGAGGLSVGGNSVFLSNQVYSSLGYFGIGAYSSTSGAIATESISARARRVSSSTARHSSTTKPMAPWAI